MLTKIFGPPGTGKTTKLLDIMEESIASGVQPERMAFLTFTVAARREAVERVEKRFGFNKKRLPYFRTLHSIAFHQSGIPRGAIFTADSIRAFGKLTSIEFTPRRYDIDSSDFDFAPGGTDGDKMLSLDHLARHRMTTVQEAIARSDVDMDPRVAAYFTRVYAEYKENEGLLDFTDLLAQAQPLDADVVIVDEAQDLSRLQWKAVGVLTERAKHVYIAGDDDQAIFAWAGADPAELISLPADEVKVLGQSYRVPGSVHKVAGYLASRLQRRQPKTWAPRQEAGAVEWLSSIEDWTPKQNESTYVLYRNHYLAADVEMRLRTLGFSYARHDRRTVSGKQWVPAIVAWERLRRGRSISFDERRAVVAATTRGKEPEEDRPWFEVLDRITPPDAQYLRNVLGRHGTPGLMAPPKIELMTIHASKGREADHVVLLTDMSRKSANGLLDGIGDDETRVWYVGVTRARKTLTVIGTENPLFSGPKSLFT